MEKQLTVNDIVLSDKAIEHISNLQSRDNEILTYDIIELTELLSHIHFNKDERYKDFTEFIISIIDFYRSFKQ